MDLSRTRVVLRERAVVDVLDLALRFLIEHGWVFARGALLVLPPFIVASIAIARAWGGLAAWSFALFFATFAAAPFTVLASRLVFEDDVRVLGAALEGLRRAPRLLVLRVFTFVGGGMGFLLFTAPGLWFLSLMLFVVEVAVLERASAQAAISRSMAIAKRESGEALVAVFLLGLLRVVATIAADAGGRAIVGALLESRAPEPMWTEGWSVLSIVGFWLFVPYAATARFFVYLDVRTKSEGWDIQTRFTALAARAMPDLSNAGGAA